MSNLEVIRKVREGPNKLKRAAKSFLRKLQKYEVKLDVNGDVDYSKVKNKNVEETLRRNENLV